jgi:hypothetical protein
MLATRNQESVQAGKTCNKPEGALQFSTSHGFVVFGSEFCTAKNLSQQGVSQLYLESLLVLPLAHEHKCSHTPGDF